MIVVVGIPAWQPGPDDPAEGRAAGLAVEIARAAVAAGARVELVGKVGEDPFGDLAMLDLSRAGIGHVAMLRDPGGPTRMLPAAEAGAVEPIPDEVDPVLLALEIDSAELAGSNGRSAPSDGETARALVLEAADLELALRYLVEFRVLVVAEDLAAPAVDVVSNGVDFVTGSLVAVVSPGQHVGLPEGATVFERPAEDPDGEFARLVGGYAAALDRGEAPERAFREATAERGWEPAG